MSAEGLYFGSPAAKALKFATEADRELYMANIVFYRGLPGKSAYEYYLDTTIDNPPLTEAEFGNLLNQMREKIETLRSDVDLLKGEDHPVQEYDSYLHFPNLGKPKVIYIDIEANESYRWDDEALKYYKINEIEIINGGN